MSIWDDPEIAPANDYVTFNTTGDTITGRIAAIEKHRWPDGSVCPRLTFETATGLRTLTAGQAGLKRQLAHLRPEVGDTVTITMTGEVNLPGGKTAKQFTVTGADTPTPAPAPAPAANGNTPDAAPLPPEAVAALKAAGITYGG